MIEYRLDEFGHLDGELVNLANDILDHHRAVLDSKRVVYIKNGRTQLAAYRGVPTRATTSVGGNSPPLWMARGLELGLSGRGCLDASESKWLCAGWRGA